MSTKELVITLRVPLSGEMFEDAAAITKAADIVSKLRRELDEEFGSNGHSLVVDTETKRASRADAGVERPQSRGPRKAKGNSAESTVFIPT